MFIKYTFLTANNKAADQTVRMRRLVCTFDVRMQQSQISSVKAHIFLYLQFHFKLYETFQFSIAFTIITGYSSIPTTV